MNTNKINKFNSLVFSLVFLRLAFLFSSTKHETTYLKKDSDHYLELADSIKFYFFNDSLRDYWLSTYRPMGYPIILNFLDTITSVPNFIYINFLGDIGTAVFVYKIVEGITDNTLTKYMSVILFFLNPNVLLSSSQIMTESLSLFFLTGSIYFVINKKILLAGLFIAIFSLFKPMGHVLLILIIIVCFFWLRYNKKELLLLSVIPILCLSLISINNQIQYESFFYSTSPYYHLQWLNGASEALCEELNFDQMEVIEPGYIFEGWKENLDPIIIQNSGLFIEKLKEDSRNRTWKNIECKGASSIHSLVWNSFGVRKAHWNETHLAKSVLNVLIYYSYFYVLLCMASLFFALFNFKEKKLRSIIYFVATYLLASSVTLPYGNSRTRLLIEPLLVIILSFYIENYYPALKRKIFR